MQIIQMTEILSLKTYFKIFIFIFSFSSIVAFSADNYPSRSIRLIVPFPPGGGGDGVARPIASLLSERIGQQIVIDNRSGAGGIIGADITAHASPDGYTLFLATTGLTALPGLKNSIPFSPTQSFDPITNAASGAYILILSPQNPARSVADLIRLSSSGKWRPSYGSAGIGTTIHLAGELFNYSANISMRHIAYQGAARAMTEVISSQIDLMFATLFTGLPQIKSGKLRGIGVSSIIRSKIAPEIPTIAESGVVNYDVTGWYGFVGPAGLPTNIKNKLNELLISTLRSQAGEERMTAQGLDVVANSPKEFANFIRNETLKWTQVIKKAGLRAD